LLAARLAARIVEKRINVAMPHYHIRWSNSKLDWEAFPSPAEAQAQAQQLVRRGESYVIEQVNGDCPQCRSLTNHGGRNGTSTVDNDPCPKEHHSSGDYEKIVDDAVALMGSDYASIQMLFPERGSGGELRLLTYRGFSPEAAHFWEWVRADSKSTCGIALRNKRRVVAPNIATCHFMVGSEDQRTYLQTGIHACQTTPLIGRSGSIVGMISTHWRIPHQPSETDFQQFDILARQAADLIEACREENPAWSDCRIAD
jgi:GAF domain-containing protein